MIKRVQDNEWGTVFPNFRKEEFMCNHKSVGDGMYHTLLEVMQEKVRNTYGSVYISCGYRCPSCNASVRGASNSAHLYSGACDFRLDSGWQDNEANRKKLVTQLRQDPRVHYCYCQVGDDGHHIWDGYSIQYVEYVAMGVYIHIDTFPSYCSVPIGEFKVEEIGEDFVRTSFKPSNNDSNAYDWCCYKLNDSDWKNMPLNNLVSGLTPNTDYKIAIKLRTKGTDLWDVSETLEFTTKDIPKETQEMPLKEEKHEDSPITPTEPEKPENEPKKEEIEHNTDKKKNVLVEFIKFILDLLAKILKKDKK